jgi:energy-coupling factor transporter ATP-binding protein EcfA2
LDPGRPAQMTAGRIFISYRRDSAAGDARALAHDLADVFGADTVFLDTSLPGGATWPSRLRIELAKAPVVLALIGPEWLMSTDEWNRRRIDSPSDWVRQEVESSLRDPTKLLIPVLLDGAQLPPKDALPTTLADLVDRQARTLNHGMWRWQLDALAEDIARHTNWRRSSATRHFRSTTLVETAVGKYSRAQLRRVETALLIGGLALGDDQREMVSPAAELVVPDLLPFQVEPPTTDHLTIEVAQHLRRATKDRARYSTDKLLSKVEPCRLVIVGGPGSGKSTLLNMMARAHILASSNDATAKTPVLLQVRDLSLSGGDSLTSEAVRDAYRWLDLKLDWDFFDELFASGRALLLVDGVDEASSVSRRNELLAKIDLFADKYENATIVVSSRIVGYDPRLLGRSFEHYELAPFSTRQARQFLASVLKSQANRAKGQFDDSSVEVIAKRIVADSRLSALAESPLMLSIVARIMIERGTADRLPRERHSLYDIAIEMMLSDWDSQRGIETAERPIHLERSEIRQALETIAYRIHAGLVQRGSTSVIESATLEHELTLALESLGTVGAHRARWQARELLRYAVGRAGLLVESGPGQFAFGHRAIQEYLAACAISSRVQGASGTDPIIEHLAGRGLHSSEWRNVNTLVVSMQRGERAQGIIEYVLDAGSAHEEWLHRDLLFVGEAFGESPALVSSIDDELAARVVKSMLDTFVVNRLETGHQTSRAAGRVLRAWRDTPFIDIARQYLRDTANRSLLVERYCAEAFVGDIELARDTLINLVVSGDTITADLAARAVRDLDVDLRCTQHHIDAIMNSIPRRVSNQAEKNEDRRLPYTAGELAALFASEDPTRDQVRVQFLLWINDEANSACLRGVAATGLGWLGKNSPEVRESLIRMLLDRQIHAGQRSWPAYALHRLGGGESEVVKAMLIVLEDDAPILCSWAQSYLSKFATRSSEVAAQLEELAEDGSRSTLPWVLSASARLSGLKPAAIEHLKSVAVSDRSIARRAGAIDTLTQCTEVTPEWRHHAAEQLVDALTSFLAESPTEEIIDDVSLGMQALGYLRVSKPETWDLCLRFLRHESEDMRMAATYGISGLPSDEHVCSKIISMLGLPEATGKVRGGLVDALHRILASDWPRL